MPRLVAVAVPEISTPDWLAELATDWYQAARPLLLIDEVRVPDSTAGDIVSFVVLGTDTRVAHGLATAASEIRGRAGGADGASLIKGSGLFGQRRRRAHDPFRDYVLDALRRCASRTRVTTSGSVLKRYELLAPGGIRLEAAPGEQAPVERIRGRELVPVMNTLKIVANTEGFGATQVDVLLDRSALLGLDPGQLGVSRDGVMILGPGEFNLQADGSPAAYQCPSRFRLICPPKRSAFRDLLLLPDALAYLTLRTGKLARPREMLAAGEEFVIESLDVPDPREVDHGDQ
jgi:hypothetical protein